jgi:hypothetical protein
MVFLALILMSTAAILIDYFKERSEKKVNKVPSFETSKLNQIPAQISYLLFMGYFGHLNCWKEQFICYF